MTAVLFLYEIVRDHADASAGRWVWTVQTNGRSERARCCLVQAFLFKYYKPKFMLDALGHLSLYVPIF